MSELDSPVGNIKTDTDLNDFFRELVTEVGRGRGFDASEATETYLISLLADAARPDAPGLELMGNASMTLLLAEALETKGSERFDRLRTLGDGVLIVSGFFGEHLARRGLQPYYVCGLGATAYSSAAEMLRMLCRDTGAPDVFGELANKFEMFVQLVSCVSEQLSLNGVHDDAALLEVYQRWLEAPSEPLTRLLIARGLLPTRASSTVH